MRLFHFAVMLATCTTTFLLCDSVVRESALDSQPGYRAEYPLHVVDINYLYMVPAKTRKGNFTFNDTNATVNTRIGKWSSGELGVIAGIRNVELGLGHKIHSENTLYGVIGAQAKYLDIDNMEWLANLIVQTDVRNTDVLRRTRYITSLNGRYEFSKKIGLYVGLYAEAGMRATIVHPLIGADYTAGNWLYQAIYPIKAGVSYQGLQNNLLSLMVRPFYTAVRIHSGPYHKPSTAVYKGIGAEFRWDWKASSLCSLWTTLGHTVSGNLFIGNGTNHHRHAFHLERVPYLQLGITIAM